MRGNGRVGRCHARRICPAGAGCPGCHRLGRCPALVHRKCRHDGDLLGRLQRAAGRGAPTAALQGHHHALLDRRPLQRRHPFQGGCVINEISAGAAPCLPSSRPPDPLLVGDRWRAMWLERLEAELLAAEWLRHPHRDAYWKHGSVAEISPPSRRRSSPWRLERCLFQRRATAARRSSQPGQGNHRPLGPRLSAFRHSGTADRFLQEALRWWDFWLKGEPTGVLRDPAVRCSRTGLDQAGQSPHDLAGALA